MAGTFTADSLADGQLPSAKGTIYTVPGATTAYIRTIKIHNTNVAAQQVQIWLNPTGTDRKTYQFTLNQDETADIDDRITLAGADTVKAQTTTASAVDYTIHGVEET